MNSFWKRKQKAVTAAVAGAILLSGCSGIPLMSEVKETKGYSQAQTMILVATERNRYESLYTNKIWDVKMEENGPDFEEYLLEQIKLFLEELKTVTLLAKEQGVTLSSAEREKVERLAEDYYSQLTSEDLSYIKADKEDVLFMYEEYCLANKMVTEVTKDMDLEISDSEAKVITIQQIEVWNQETAQTVWAKTQEEGADFASIAKEYSLNPDLERKLGRGEDDKGLEEAAFALEEGEISQVIPVGQSYYIVKCLDDYDPEATQERKNKLVISKKDQIFREIYNEFAEKNPVVFEEEMWDSIQFSSDDKSDTENFFQLYKEYFPE